MSLLAGKIQVGMLWQDMLYELPLGLDATDAEVEAGVSALVEQSRLSGQYLPKLEVTGIERQKAEKKIRVRVRTSSHLD